MADNKRIRNIKSNYERVIQGLITGFKQFYYVNTGGYVKPDTTYSIYYMPSKKSIYLIMFSFLGKSSFILQKIFHGIPGLFS